MLTIAQLKQVPIFHDLSPDALKALASIAEVRRMEKGEVLFQHGERRGEFLVILRGQLHIYRTFQDEVQTLAILDRNEFAVETSLANPDMKHEHFGEAFESGELIVIDGKEFLKLREKHPAIANAIYGAIIENLATRLHHANNKIATIYSTGKIAATYDDLDHLTDLLLTTIMEIIRAKRAIFVLYKPLEGMAVVRDAKGYSNNQEMRNLTVALQSDPILGILFHANRDLLITGDQFAQEKELHTPYASRTMLGTPLRLRDNTIGAILLGEKEGGREFSHNNQILLNIIARQVVLAVATAQTSESVT